MGMKAFSEKLHGQLFFHTGLSLNDTPHTEKAMQGHGILQKEMQIFFEEKDHHLRSLQNRTD